MKNKEKNDDDVIMTGKVSNSVQPQSQESEEPVGGLSTVEELAALKKQVQILRESVRQDKLAQADKRILGEKKTVPVGHLKRLRGKVVVRWYGPREEGSQAKQEIIYQNNNAISEHIVGHYKTIDGDDIVCDMVGFLRGNDLEYFDKIGGTRENWIIQFHDSELAAQYPDYEINVKFINP